MKLLTDVGEKTQEAYGVAGGIVEQALSSIRTVYSYVREEKTMESYSAALQPISKFGFRQGLMKGMAIGSVGIAYATWALQGWYGSILVTEKGIKGGNAFIAGLCVFYGLLGLGNCLMNVKYFMEANVSAGLIFEMIERVPIIDSADQQRKTMSDVRGELEFKDIDFAYPSRPETLVLQKFNLKIMACQTVGLVGGSGSGKSTVINLLEGFYDPLGGEILPDGINIKTLQLKWLRSQMGLVSQEPVLFATSIKENILFGKEEASQAEIAVAAKAADAHNFIMQFPDGYDTQVGQLGIQVSGGQKQRISIARALLRDPKIFLLDEATLDSLSEKAVQDALNQASVGHSTIIITHRLSTLQKADMIAVIQSGQVVECGSPDDLIQNSQGTYLAMVQRQQAFMSEETVSPSETVESINSFPDGYARGVERRNELTPQSSRGGNNREEEELYIPSLKQLMQMTEFQWKPILLGCTGALCAGLIQPVHGFCQGGLLSVFFIIDHDELKYQTKIYCFACITIAVTAFTANAFQHYYFGVKGENLTKKIRETTFAKILTFEIKWFDREDNSSGGLYSRLSTDAAMVRTLVADSLPMVIQAISGATFAAVLGLVLSWKLALLAISIQPLIIASFLMRALMMRSMSKKISKAQNKSIELASEAIGNHRIISAFYAQEKIMALFEVTQTGPKKESQKQSRYAGLGLCSAQFLVCAIGALLFWCGGKLLYHGEITYKHVFQTFFSLVLTGRVVAEIGCMNLDLVKGTNALKSICMTLKRSKMNPDMVDGIKPVKINGDIELKEVDFFYSTRPKQIILMGLSLKIGAGKIVALVGPSGSGKSTIISMIQRFYDPSKGSVEIDGFEVKCYNLKALRSHIAWVGQEPTIFAGTILDNIAYGKENATEAATLANAHEFISSVEDGYATCCGGRGTQLSGGQKQRLALARAILKNPAILLLDKATSALDVKTEKLVQDAERRSW